MLLVATSLPAPSVESEGSAWDPLQKWVPSGVLERGKTQNAHPQLQPIQSQVQESVHAINVQF